MGPTATRAMAAMAQMERMSGPPMEERSIAAVRLACAIVLSSPIQPQPAVGATPETAVQDILMPAMVETAALALAQSAGRSITLGTGWLSPIALSQAIQSRQEMAELAEPKARAALAGLMAMAGPA